MTSLTGFLETRRRSGVISRCGRFRELAKRYWQINDGVAKDLIGLTVNGKDIALHGLCFFGSDNSNYTVTLEVKDTNNNLTLMSKSGTYSSKLLQCKHFNYYGFEVLFDSAAVLKKNKRYQIEALVSGPDAECRFYGFGTVEVSGVTFTFSTVSRNRTTTNKGQFPEFLFSL